MQFLYRNQRRKCVNNIMTKGSKPCKIPIALLHESFSARWEPENNQIRQEYRQVDPVLQQDLDRDFNAKIDEEEVKHAIKLINSDTAPGRDKVFIRALKSLECSTLLANVGRYASV